MGITKQWLFFDRAEMCSGASIYGFDEKRLTPEGRKQVETLIDYWHFHATIGEHRFGEVKAPFGLRFCAEEARMTDKLFPMDRPWEKGMLGWVSGAYDAREGLYKLWYTMKADESLELRYADGSAYEESELTYYAYSRDGEVWERPQLDVIASHGAWTNAVGIPIGEGTVFMDPRHPDTGRFKAVTARTSTDERLDIKDRVYLALYASDDGVHWREITDDPLRYFFDTQNNIYFDEALGKYVSYLRGHYYGRAIQRGEGDDIRHMPMPDILMYPDNEDPLDMDYYNNCATVYPYDPSIRLMFPSVYTHRDDRIHMRMAVSRDGYRYHWVSREAVVGNEDERGNQLNHVYGGPHLLPMGEKLGLALRTINLCHNESYFVSAYGGDYPLDCGVRMALWEKDRLACLCADELGEFYLNAHIPEDGRLEINARALGQGSVRAGVYPIDSEHPYPGFELEAGDRLCGDQKWTEYRWKGNASLSALAGKDVHIRFQLSRAKLYGCRLASGEEETPSGGNGLTRLVSAL